MIPSPLRKNFWKICLTLIVVSGSYGVASLFLQGITFYVFDAIWRISVVGWIIGFCKFHLNLSKRQYLALSILFLTEFSVYRYLAPSFPIIRIFISVIGAPLLEELLFRGWIMDRIEGAERDKILYSSLFFSLYHLKNVFVLSPLALLYQLLYAGLIVGPLFGWVRLRYKTLFTSILLHSGNNCVADVITARISPLLMQRKKNFT